MYKYLLYKVNIVVYLQLRLNRVNNTWYATAHLPPFVNLQQVGKENILLNVLFYAFYYLINFDFIFRFCFIFVFLEQKLHNIYFLLRVFLVEQPSEPLTTSCGTDTGDIFVT